MSVVCLLWQLPWKPFWIKKGEVQDVNTAKPGETLPPKKPLSFILRISPVFYIYDSWVCNIFGMSFECSAGFKLTAWLKCCRDFRFKRTQKFVISCCCSVRTELRMYKVLKRTCCAILLLIRYFVSFSLLSLSWSSLSPYSHEKGDVWKEWTR